MSRVVAAVLSAALLAGLTAGCANAPPSAEQLRSGRAWLALHGRQWDRYAASAQAEMEAILGPTGDVDTGVVAGCHDAQARFGPRGTRGLPLQPFPVDGPRRRIEGMRVAVVLQQCVDGHLSQARQLAHREIDHLSAIRAALVPYRS